MKRHKHTKPFKSAKKQHISPVVPINSYQHGLLHPASALSPRSPANIGRSRAPGNLSSALRQTPPRASYANKVKGIFSHAASNSPPKPLFPNLVLHEMSQPIQDTPPPSIAGSEGSSSSASLLTSESELERRLDSANEFWNEQKKARQTSTLQPKAATWKQPSVPLTASSRLPIPKIKEPSPQKEQDPPGEESSDAWTDDEIFLPKAVRQQARIQKNMERQRQILDEREQRRQKYYQELVRHRGDHPDKLREIAGHNREVRQLLEISPLRKSLGPDWDPKNPKSPSRFRPPLLSKDELDELCEWPQLYLYEW